MYKSAVGDAPRDLFTLPANIEVENKSGTNKCSAFYFVCDILRSFIYAENLKTALIIKYNFYAISIQYYMRQTHTNIFLVFFFSIFKDIHIIDSNFFLHYVLFL